MSRFGFLWPQSLDLIIMGLFIFVFLLEFIVYPDAASGEVMYLEAQIPVLIENQEWGTLNPTYNLDGSLNITFQDELIEGTGTNVWGNTWEYDILTLNGLVYGDSLDFTLQINSQSGPAPFGRWGVLESASLHFSGVITDTIPNTIEGQILADFFTYTYWDPGGGIEVTEKQSWPETPFTGRIELPQPDPIPPGTQGSNPKIAFSSDRDGNAEIYVMNADGSNPTRLTNIAGQDIDPSWSADGMKIAFSSDRDGNAEIYVMNADGTNPTRLTENLSVDCHPSWSSIPILLLSASLPDTIIRYDNAFLRIPVGFTDTLDQGILSAEVFFAYDGDLLTAFSVGISNTLLTSAWLIETNIVDGIGTSMDTIKMAMATDDDTLSGAGTLINVNFQIAGTRHPASSPLTLTHVYFNNSTPDESIKDGSVTLVGTEGVITSLPSEILPRWSIGVSVYDLDEDRNTGMRDGFAVNVANDSQTETLTVTETGNSTGTFTGTISTAFSLSFSSGDGIIQAKAGDQIVFSYADSLDSAGNTQMRTAATDVLGGTDGLIRATVVSQPGDTVRVRVSDADLSDAVAVSVANPRTGETESVLLSQFTSGESHFYGRFFTDSQAGAVGDSTLEVAKGDVLSITYADTLTAEGGMADVADDDEVVDPFGDAHPNGSVQAYDAAQVLIHRLSTYGGGAGTLSGLDSLSANLDQGAPFGIIDGYDASLILRKVVGLISRFEVQEPDAVNHPQPETELRPKPVPEERRLALVPGEGYVSVWCEEREEIVSGELTLAGVQGQVAMGEELRAFLTASQATDGSLQVVFAGAEAVSGPGELLRVAGVGPGDARLTRVSFNGGQIGARWEKEAASVAVPASFALYPNVPNPFNPETTIRFSLARESLVRLEVFDVVGQRVLVLVAERLPAGTHQALWDGRGESGERVSSGVYFCRLLAQHEAGEFRQVQRMLLLK